MISTLSMALDSLIFFQLNVSFWNRGGVGVRAPQHTLLTVLWCFLSDEWWWRHECSWGETVLTPMDFRNNLALRFGFLPSGLPTRCYGCGEPCTVAHAICARRVVWCTSATTSTLASIAASAERP